MVAGLRPPAGVQSLPMDRERDYSPGRHVRLHLPAVPASVSIARHAFAALITDTAIERRDSVVLAVSEAVSNAVLHAYVDRPAEDVDLFGIRSDDQLILTVTDHGRGLDRPAANPGMGMGLHLIRGAADQALIAEREHGGTSVQCRFVLTRDRAASGA
jgi:stage II sporulation protein AB (anti-sigma F factor)